MTAIVCTIAGLLLTTVIAFAASAETIRAPLKGEPALAVELPTGWQPTQIDDNNVYALSPGSKTMLQLSMVRADDLANYTLAQVAAIILKAAGAKPYSSTRPGMVLGRTGAVFLSELVNNNGVHMAANLHITRLDKAHAASIITVIADSASDQDRADLAALEAKIRLIGAGS
jgi:hypothetical protein